MNLTSSSVEIDSGTQSSFSFVLNDDGMSYDVGEGGSSFSVNYSGIEVYPKRGPVDIYGDLNLNPSSFYDGDLTLAGHDSPIGTVLEASDATWSVPTSIDANLNPSGSKVTCGAGTWVITADVTFPTGSGRNRQAGPSVNGNLQSYNRVNCYDTAAGHLTATTIRTSDTAFTAGVCIGCSATTTSKGNAWVKAVRIA